jgi:hypothetical protein
MATSVICEKRDPFADVFGSRRGRRYRLPLAANARPRMHARGYARTASASEISRLQMTVAAHAQCLDCGHVGLRPELYLRVRTRRLLLAAVFAFAVSVVVVCRVIAIADGGVIAFCAAVVGWHVARDFGYSVLGVCSLCRSAQQL